MDIVERRLVRIVEPILLCIPTPAAIALMVILIPIGMPLVVLLVIVVAISASTTVAAATESTIGTSATPSSICHLSGKLCLESVYCILTNFVDR